MISLPGTGGGEDIPVEHPNAPRRPIGAGPAIALAAAAILALGFMAGIFLLGIWSNTGRIQSPEQYAANIEDLLPFGYAFVAGMVASVNPCGFMMLPAFVGYTLGNASGDPKEISPAQLLRALMLGITVTMGFLALFSAIGIVIVAGGDALVDIFPWAGLVIGVGLTTLGLWLIVTGRSIGLAIAGRVAPKGGGAIGTFLYGVAYGSVSLSCSLPIFLVVVATSLATRGVIPSLGQFLAFGLGMGVVITAVSLGAASFKDALTQSLRGLVPYVHRLSAVFLAGAGVYLIVYWVWLGDIFE